MRLWLVMACLFLLPLAGLFAVEDSSEGTAQGNSPTVSALLEALDDEYHAWAFYDQVIRDHGAQQPFSNIRDAEQRHADALTVELQRLGADVPANPADKAESIEAE